MEQIVVRKSNGQYFVRTYSNDKGGKPVLERETHASTRDVAQATMDGRIVDVNE